MKKSILVFVKACLILLFAYTLIHKINDIETFETTLIKSTIINPSFIPIIKYATLFIEFIVIILLIKKNSMFGFYASLLTLTTFTVYLIALNNFSLYTGCSCGGFFNELSYTNHLIVNFIFILLSILGIIFTPDLKKSN